MIGEDQISPSPLKAKQGFQHHGPLINPALFSGCLHHGVFTAYVVSRNWQLGFATQTVDDVQVGQARLDHQNVGSLLFIEQGFGERFTSIGRIHLIG